MDKIKIESIAKYIEFLGYTKEYSLEIVSFIAEEVFDLLCEACCRTDFPSIAYRHIEKMIAYRFILNDLELNKLIGIEKLEKPIFNAKSVSIENTTVEMNSQSVQEITLNEYRGKIQSLYDSEYTGFVHRYRVPIWF